MTDIYDNISEEDKKEFYEWKIKKAIKALLTDGPKGVTCTGGYASRPLEILEELCDKKSFNRETVAVLILKMIDGNELIECDEYGSIRLR